MDRRGLPREEEYRMVQQGTGVSGVLRGVEVRKAEKENKNEKYAHRSTSSATYLK